MIEKMRAIEAWLRKGQRMAVALGLALCVSLSASAVVELGKINDGVDRNDPNFVKASLLIASRGEMLFSCAGHTAFRLQCPKFNLDQCFSYESESIAERIWAFFCGTLKMGLFSLPTAEFVRYYKLEGRGVTEYPMNLPPAIKQRLWKILDDKAAEGANLPYEYLKRGCCVQTAFNILQDAIVPDTLDSSKAKELPYNSIREVFAAEVTPTHPWAMFMLHAICGTGVDRSLKKREKLVVPEDLEEFLRHSTIGGVPVISEAGKMFIPQTTVVPRSFFSPVVVGWLLVLVSVINYFWKRPYGDWVLLLLQSAAGAFFMYLVCLSSLPGTTWNWLIVPFNLLPLVFWRWRRRWALGFVGVLLAWEALMLLWPYKLTDCAYEIMALAYVVLYLKFTRFAFRFKERKSE